MFDSQTIAEDVVRRLVLHYQRIGRHVSWAESAQLVHDSSQPTPMHGDIARFVEIANGSLDRATTDEQTIALLIERFQNLLDLLFLPATGQYVYRIPPSFWSEPGIGQVLARVQAWLRQDDLITYTQAAQLLFPDMAMSNIQAARMRVKRLTERGELMVYIAPDEPNPTQQARVSRQATEALRDAGYAF